MTNNKQLIAPIQFTIMFTVTAICLLIVACVYIQSNDTSATSSVPSVDRDEALMDELNELFSVVDVTIYSMRTKRVFATITVPSTVEVHTAVREWCEQNGPILVSDVMWQRK